MTDITGRIALITGAARGQGRSHALTLAAAGADIVATDISKPITTVPYELATPDDLAGTVAEVEKLGRSVIGLECDVRDGAALDRAVEAAISHFGKIDILVANAGIWALGPLWELTDDQWQDMIDVNLTGVWRSIKAVVPAMIANRGGSIVLTSSVNGFEAGAGFGHYVAAKHGVLGLMRNAALELGRYNIRCNAVCPGFVDTKMNDWQGAYDMMAGGPGGTREDRQSGAHNWSVLAGRGALSPVTISKAVLWLASDDAADVTGVALPVDGGHLILPGINADPVHDL
jgi:SDR family mycofactocin-dependent oxidoreductase